MNRAPTDAPRAFWRAPFTHRENGRGSGSRVRPVTGCGDPAAASGRGESRGYGIEGWSRDQVCQPLTAVTPSVSSKGAAVEQATKPRSTVSGP